VHLSSVQAVAEEYQGKAYESTVCSLEAVNIIHRSTHGSFLLAWSCCHASVAATPPSLRVSEVLSSWDSVPPPFGICARLLATHVGLSSDRATVHSSER
jgi:hypothetical protein